MLVWSCTPSWVNINVPLTRELISPSCVRRAAPEHPFHSSLKAPNTQRLLLSCGCQLTGPRLFRTRYTYPPQPGMQSVWCHHIITFRSRSPPLREARRPPSHRHKSSCCSVPNVSPFPSMVTLGSILPRALGGPPPNAESLVHIMIMHSGQEIATHPRVNFLFWPNISPLVMICYLSEKCWICVDGGNRCSRLKPEG